jgi:hypothetical protein
MSEAGEVVPQKELAPRTAVQGAVEGMNTQLRTAVAEEICFAEALE